MQTASGFPIGIWLQGNAIIITDQENKMYINDQLFVFDKLSHLPFLHMIFPVYIFIT